MFDSALREELENILSLHFNDNVVLSAFNSISGGCINAAFKVETNIGNFFVKLNDFDSYPKMFEKEAKGLQLLSDTHVIRLPKVIGFRRLTNCALLILEYEEVGSPSNNFWERFGNSIAQLHQVSSKLFGLDYDNYIGSLNQINQWTDSWFRFFVEQRIEKQLHLGIDKGYLDVGYVQKFNKLYRLIEHAFPLEQPALLHGDLWNGNFMTGCDGEALVYDPACYFGHREAELAFTELFGGFDPLFYEAYSEAFPLEPGFSDRKDIYNLYPLLVHLNLFGSGYRSSIDRILKKMS